MIEKHYPTKKELNELWWYRLGIVLKWALLVATFFAPQFLGRSWIDGLMNAIIWYFLCVLVGKLTLYVIYGNKPKPKLTEEEIKANNNKYIGLAIILTIVTLLALSFLVK